MACKALLAIRCISMLPLVQKSLPAATEVLKKFLLSSLLWLCDIVQRSDTKDSGDWTQHHCRSPSSPSVGDRGGLHQSGVGTQAGNCCFWSAALSH
mmetsp:Transcript_16242/g.24465  ORF Transcript_16242/g.24465 Transcript_16242/m.24465 type:complete len:96 (+) Transcript_16242:165-452(+)